MAEKTSKTADAPVTLDDILKSIQTVNTLTVTVFGNPPERTKKGGYLPDPALVKAQNLLLFLQSHPEIYPRFDRNLLAAKITDYGVMANFSKEIAKPLDFYKNSAIVTGQDIYKSTRNIYKKAKADLETGVDYAPEDLKTLVNDLAELFEKGATTRRKNARMKKEQKKGGDTNAG